MPRRKSNLGCHTRGVEAFRRVIANEIEEEQASAKERNRQRMAQIHAEEAAKRQNAWRSRFVPSDQPSYLLYLRSQQNERDRTSQKKKKLVHLFKTAIDMMPSDTYIIVINADKTPAGERVRVFSAPTVDEVTIIIVGDQFQLSHIVLHRRNDQLTKVAETR
ncbi:uncharacterized protein NPIL_323341 [Nephila pilipes]|uniref:Uncharacterized protein n=1 Tax=Nephila pilipes TaxID=299642 RepID=A0A8X6MAA4_NEPPI|nr:uncharacterized protein NPIL_323341 [Nephila pilipes]